MQRVEILAMMEFQTTEPYSPWENKYKSVIRIIKGNANRRRVQRNITNRVRDFGMVWEEEIFPVLQERMDDQPYND